MPPLGFDSEASSIIFLYDLESWLPTASTCSIQLRLPISHGDKYQQFKDNFFVGCFW